MNFIKNILRSISGFWTGLKPASDSGISLAEVIHHKEIPVEWEIVKSIYKTEPWSGFFNSERLGVMFLYTNPMLNRKSRSLNRLLSYLDAHQFSTAELLEDWGSETTLTRIAELLSTFNFKLSTFTTDLVHFKGRSYAVHRLELGLHEESWIDHAGNIKSAESLGDALLLYVRSINTAEPDDLKRNLTHSLRSGQNCGVFSPFDHIGLMAKLQIETKFNKDSVVKEFDSSEDRYVTLRKITCHTVKYPRLAKYVTRTLVALGKTWGSTPCTVYRL